MNVIRMRGLTNKLGISRSSIYEMLKADSPRYDHTFPRPVKIGSRSVGWIEPEVDEWLRKKREE